MLELEKTYLAKRLPENLKNCRSEEIIDIYIPKQSAHPVLRIRKKGTTFAITKKEPIDERDASCQEEQTIELTEAEFNALDRVEGKRIHKTRYCYKNNGRIAEIDVFQDNLKGLVLVDFEFMKTEDKDNFKMPDFCLADVTQATFLAGGMLCGKTYQDIKYDLNRFKYKKLEI